MTTALYGLGIYGVDTYGEPPGPPGPPPWEEVYGPDYPLTMDDVPVLENGICRVTFEKAEAAFSLHRHDGTVYVEAGRFSFWRGADQHLLLRPFVKEWTPERAVVGGTFQPVDQFLVRCEVYLTLQRGWSGPRVEVYSTITGVLPPGVGIVLAPAVAGAATLGRSSGTDVVGDGTDYGAFAGGPPWAYLLGQDPNLALHLAVLQEEATLVGRADSTMYGAPRSAISLLSPAGDGYVSATLGIGPRGDAAADAENLGRTNLMDCRAVPLLVER